MTDLEYEVLDELYFVISYEGLIQATHLESETLKATLEGLLSKGWLKCFSDASTELSNDEIRFESNYRKYHYLASKAGLKAHNSL